jgi:hypothetical protein
MVARRIILQILMGAESLVVAIHQFTGRANDINTVVRRMSAQVMGATEQHPDSMHLCQVDDTAAFRVQQIPIESRPVLKVDTSITG